MNNDTRQALAQALSMAPGVVHAPRRLEGLLRDLCPEDLREVSVLVEALERGCVHTLLSTPHDGRALNALARELSEGSAVAMRWAIWAIETWHIAVGDAAQARQPPTPTSTKILARDGSIWEVLSAPDHP